MAITLRWVHKIDGVDLNDGVAFVDRVPEVLTYFGAQTRLTDMQARTPVFDRQQPVPGRYTHLLQVLFDDDDQYQARLAILKTLTGPGLHTYTCAQPGQDDAGQSLAVYFETGLIVDDTDVGYCTAKAVAPDPTWT